MQGAENAQMASIAYNVPESDGVGVRVDSMFMSECFEDGIWMY